CAQPESCSSDSDSERAQDGVASDSPSETYVQRVQFSDEAPGGYFAERDADTRGLLDYQFDSPLQRWLPDEFPPNPLDGDTRDRFFKRMELAWQRRDAFIRNRGLSLRPSVR